MSDLMTEFRDVVHHIATVGEHVIEFADGDQAIAVNGATVTVGELETFARAIYQAAVALGAIAPAT